MIAQVYIAYVQVYLVWVQRTYISVGKVHLGWIPVHVTKAQYTKRGSGYFHRKVHEFHYSFTTQIARLLPLNITVVRANFS